MEPISKLAHGAMKVTDMDKALEFYCGTLGFTHAFTLRDDNDTPIIQYLKIAGGVFLELFYGGERPEPPSFERVGYHHICYTVGDIKACHAQLIAAGLDLAPLGEGEATIWAEDPDGNRLEITQYRPEDKLMRSNRGGFDFNAKGLTGIGHVGYVVSDMEASLAFYRDRLGLEVAMEGDRDGKPFLKFLRVCDGAFVELFYGGASAAEQARSFQHLCLECRDLKASVEELRSRGVEIDTEIRQGRDTNFQAWIHDPDGNKIELMQINPASPQARA